MKQSLCRNPLLERHFKLKKLMLLQPFQPNKTLSILVIREILIIRKTINKIKSLHLRTISKVKMTYKIKQGSAIIFLQKAHVLLEINVGIFIQLKKLKFLTLEINLKLLVSSSLVNRKIASEKIVLTAIKFQKLIPNLPKLSIFYTSDQATVLLCLVQIPKQALRRELKHLKKKGPKLNDQKVLT